MKLFLSICTLALQFYFHNKADCQTKKEIGISLQIEKTTALTEEVYPYNTKTSNTNPNFGFGVIYERAFSKHSSCVIGGKYRRAVNDITYPIPSGGNSVIFIHYSIVENFVGLPFSYKYNSDIVNLSTGIVLDYFLSWRQQKGKSYFAPLPSYDLYFNKKLSVGILTSISKTLALDKNIFFEPSIYYNPMLTFKRTYYGISVSMKYIF